MLFVFKSLKKKCTSAATGTIVRCHSLGLDSPTLVYVEYCVDSKTYTLKESLKLKIEVDGLIQRKIPVLGDVKPDTKVRVFYNPMNPKKAYLPDNEGHITS